MFINRKLNCKELFNPKFRKFFEKREIPKNIKINIICVKHNIELERMFKFLICK